MSAEHDATRAVVRGSEWYVSRDGGQTCIAWFGTRADADFWLAQNGHMFPDFSVCRNIRWTDW